MKNDVLLIVRFVGVVGCVIVIMICGFRSMLVLWMIMLCVLVVRFVGIVLKVFLLIEYMKGCVL